MAVDVILRRLRALGVMLSVSPDGSLAFDAPAGAIDDELLAELRAHRAELLTLVRSVPVVVHLRRDAFDVRIDRRSKWGNPFKIGPDGDRAQVIEKYRAWIVGQAGLIAALPELRGKRLGCWCAPLPCHGDVLAELVRDRVIDTPDDAIESASVVCPWCRRGDRLIDCPSGIDCDRCGRLAWRAVGDALERVDYVELPAVEIPIAVPVIPSVPVRVLSVRAEAATQSDLLFGGA